MPVRPKKELPLAASFVFAAAGLCAAVVAAVQTGRWQTAPVAGLVVMGGFGVLAHLLGYEPARSNRPPSPAVNLPPERPPRPRGPPFRPAEPEVPGPSPYPWVADEVWRQRRQRSRAANPGVTRRPTAAVPEPRDPGVDASPEPVSPAQQAVAPRAPGLGLTPPPEMTPEVAEAALAGMAEGVGVWWQEGEWPMCCGALTVLVLAAPTDAELAALEARVGPIDGAGLGGAPEEAWADVLAWTRAGHPPEVSLHVHVCARCGALYGRFTGT